MKSYPLKWSQHLANMGIVFSTLYQSEGLSDVTLFCDDGKVRAHKLLLSTCSDFFLVSLISSLLTGGTVQCRAGRGGEGREEGRVMISKFIINVINQGISNDLE